MYSKNDDETLEHAEEKEPRNEKRKYNFNGKHIYVTWSKSTIDDKERFSPKVTCDPPPGRSSFVRSPLWWVERNTGIDRTCQYNVVQ